MALCVIIYMRRIIFRILCIYHDKDIGLITGSVLQSGISHMTMWCLSFPLSKMVECSNTNPQIEYFWGPSEVMDIRYLINRKSQQRQPLALLLPSHCIPLIEPQGRR